ncbi:long-chain fatty acid--CoA ligase [Corallococcus sp. M34]|uniref:class I adenylate-forming enzyme family protein n=1 Tax=Citreicoccus inhibens TaxID=2849499 RepID=UPI001C21FED3|nr:AMP-binding protein [Citreicoccus inhibens]MBU8895214.1 long-chain fatty acid--CoA ligase [Citreicoccus inhibens]
MTPVDLPPAGPPASGEARPSGASLLDRLLALPTLSLLDAQGRDTGDVRERAARLARALRGAGVPPGGRVGVALPNGPEFVIALVACLEARATFVPLSLALSPEVRDRRLERIHAAARVDAHGVVRREAPPPEPAVPVPAVILFTSGSEGDGRPVALPESALLHVIDTHHPALAYEPGTRVTGYLPWSHAFGFTLELLMGLLHGARVRSVPPPSFPEVLASEPPGFLFTVPRMLERLDAATLRALRGGVVGGAPVRGALREHLQGSRLRVGYGQTECAPGASLGEAGEWNHDDFLGRALGCELELCPAGDGEHQELRVRGANLGLGYVEGARIQPFPLDTGWRATGDLASAVDGGFVSEGRRDELFKLDNGRMVNPVPLELPFDGRILLVGMGRDLIQPLARGEVPSGFTLPIPHLPPRLMPESFWSACTTPTGKVSRRRAQRLFEES